jgi:4-amino-4-deoxy-L-arabinose transferase-like glycosyltransferase
MTQRQNYSLLLLLLASVVMNLVYTPYYNPLSCDTEVYRYVSLVMKKGGVPYRDVFDHKPPLIYFISYTGLFLGGWLQWIFNTLLAVLATLLFYRLGKKYRLAFPWLLPLLFNLMLRDFLICGTGGNTREYTTVLTLIFFCVLMGEQRWRYYILGFLAGLIFFFQQDQIFALIPFFIYALIRKEDIPLHHRIFGSAAGGLLVAAPIVLYFALNHALTPFWRDAFGFNFGWYTTAIKSSFGDHFRRVKQVLDAGNYEVPFLVAVSLGVGSLMWRSSNKRLVLTSLAAVILSISPEFMGGRGTMGTFYHYYLPLSATLCILLFCVFAFIKEPFLQERKAMGIFGVLVCTSVSYTFLQHITHLVPRKENHVVASPELVYLRQHPPGDYQLYEFGNHNYVCAYNEFRILAPSTWIYHHFWHFYANWDKDLSILGSIEQDLLRHRTAYIIDAITDPVEEFHDPAAFTSWRSFLLENYQQVPLTDTTGVTLWKWKELVNKE